MKILHLSNTPLSNAPANLAQIQSDARHTTLLLLDRQSNTNKVFVGGELWNSYSEEWLEAYFWNADVIHFHNFAREQKIFQNHPHLWDICLKKPCLIQYHSPRNSTESFEETIQDSFFRGRKAVIAQYHVRQYPEAEFIVPNVIPIFDQRFMPLANKRTNNPIRVSFAASQITGKDWENKGFMRTRQILFELERAGDIQADVIINTPYEETLIRKKWADIGMEELVTGSYHMSYLEYMSMGVPTLCNLDRLTRDALKTVVGEEGIAAWEGCYLWSELDNLATRLKDIRYNKEFPETLKELSKKSRTWMEKHWNPTTFNHLFEGIYAKL